MDEVRVSSWEQAKNIAEREVEERLKGKIKSSWVEGIWLTPYSEGSKWIIKLKVVISRGILRNKGYNISMVLNSFTGEVEEFEAEESVKS